MIIQLQANANPEELADATEALCELIEHADEVELPPAAVGLLVALDDALEHSLAAPAEGP